MRAVVFSSRVAVAAALVLAACAHSTDSSDVASIGNAGTDGAGADGGACPCSGGEVCSQGECVPATTDSDADGFTADKDCNDHDPAIHPGATEICNGVDDNCDGTIDEGFDADGDGYPTCATEAKAADCDDGDPAVHPGAVEVCNGKDDDCNGKIDDGYDKDNDGFYTCQRGTVGADCDDSDPNVHPGAPETCDGKDNDCDGKVDDIPATLTGSLSSPVNAHWALAGLASYTGSGWAQLTPDNTSAPNAGSLWWNAPYTFDTFDMTATIWIQDKAGADGMAFGWVPGNDVTKTGAGGGGFGFYGLGGWAVAIDTFQDAGEPAAPFLTVVDESSGTQLARTAIPNVRDANNHTFRVRLDAGAVSVWIDGIDYLNAFALPGYAAFSGHWGFSGATGGFSEEHWVTGITMSFPNGQGCVP